MGEIEQLSFFAELGIEDPKEVTRKKKESERQAKEEAKKKKEEAKKAAAEARRSKYSRPTTPKEEVFPDNLPIVVLYARAVRDFEPGTSLEMVKTTISREFQELSGNDTQWPWEIKDRSPEGELGDPKKKDAPPKTKEPADPSEEGISDDKEIEAASKDDPEETVKAEPSAETKETGKDESADDGFEPPPEGWVRVVQVKPIVTFARKG